MPEQSPDTASLHSRSAAAKRAVDHARSLENVDLISIAMGRDERPARRTVTHAVSEGLVPAKVKAKTTARGLGWRHQQAVAKLKANHRDGSPCWWCARPMHRDTARNWDGRTLAGDHSVPRSQMAGSLADRLLHSTCNEQRGDGQLDHERPSLTGVDRMTITPATGIDVNTLVMPWPA